MDENKKQPSSQDCPDGELSPSEAQAPLEAGGGEKEPEFKNGKETLYDKIPVDLKTLDRILVFLFAILGVMLVLGIIKGNMH